MLFCTSLMGTLRNSFEGIHTRQVQPAGCREDLPSKSQHPLWLMGLLMALSQPQALLLRHLRTPRVLSLYLSSILSSSLVQARLGLHSLWLYKTIVMCLAEKVDYSFDSPPTDFCLFLLVYKTSKSSLQDQVFLPCLPDNEVCRPLAASGFLHVWLPPRQYSFHLMEIRNCL